MSWKYQLKLPPLSKFKGSKKSKDPYNLMYEWLLANLSESQKKEISNVSDIGLHSIDCSVLSKHAKAWLKISGPIRTGSYLEGSLAMLKLQCEPVTCDKVSPGYIGVVRNRNE